MCTVKDEVRGSARHARWNSALKTAAPGAATRATTLPADRR